MRCEAFTISKTTEVELFLSFSKMKELVWQLLYLNVELCFAEVLMYTGYPLIGRSHQGVYLKVYFVWKAIVKFLRDV